MKWTWIIFFSGLQEQGWRGLDAAVWRLWQGLPHLLRPAAHRDNPRGRLVLPRLCGCRSKFYWRLLKNRYYVIIIMSPFRPGRMEPRPPVQRAGGEQAGLAGRRAGGQAESFQRRNPRWRRGFWTAKRRKRHRTRAAARRKKTRRRMFPTLPTSTPTSLPALLGPAVPELLPLWPQVDNNLFLQSM